MMRILLATGEEAVYRTVDELALGISSGVVTAAARFFDSASQGWQGIDSHPAYHRALARAALLVPDCDLDPLPLKAAAPTPEQADAKARIYQMFSLSAAELQAKRRPAWLLPGLAAIGGLAMVVSVLSVLRLRREPGPDRADQLASASASLPGRLPTGSQANPALTSVEAMRLAPINLNAHQVFAMEDAGRRLGDTATALGITALLHPARLTSPDSIRRTRSRLLTLRDLIAAYRAQQRSTAVAYRDTAAMLARTGFWSRVDQQEWKVFPSAMESASDAAQADTLLRILERLYTVLADQSASYRSASGRLVFRDSLRGAEYERLRNELSRLETSTDSVKSRELGALGVLRRAIRQPAPASAPPVLP
jgi:hypothetical protein